jgi:hypothetical protein
MLVTALSTFFMFRVQGCPNGHDNLNVAGRPAPGGSFGSGLQFIGQALSGAKLTKRRTRWSPVILPDDQAVGNLRTCHHVIDLRRPDAHLEGFSTLSERRRR